MGEKLSIDLKAHGLRVKPLEWSRTVYIEWVAHTEFTGRMGRLYSILMILDKFKIQCATDETLYSTLGDAQAVCQRHHESQVLALLEQVEGEQ